LPVTEATRAIEAVWRIEAARLIAGLARITGDVGLAEDMAQDALVVAMEKWPQTGVPDNPGAWLMATAKNRAIDRLRRDKTYQRKREEVAHDTGALFAMERSDFEAAVDDEIGDDLLALIFTCCHPLLSREARVALTLRLLGGLTTAEIARAFLAGESTVAQRLVRAKKTLREARVPFEVPRGAELDERLPSVLEVIYLVFNEGYAASAGEDWVRTDLCEEALRLGRILAELEPKEPEVHGLVALMEIQASRLHARRGPGGEPVLLLEQDRGRWDPLLIVRGRRALERAEGLPKPIGPYGLQAAIAACHARAIRAENTDWVRIAALYETLGQVQPSPIVELNRAVAIGMAFGPEPGLALIAEIENEPTLADNHLLPSVRGDLLEKAGRNKEASSEFKKAADLTGNDRERELLLRRAEGDG